MPLRLRILLWVSSLFLATIMIVFALTNLEIRYNLKAEEQNLVKQVKAVDEKNFENILKYLSASLNNESEKIFNAFISIGNSPQWLLHFLPDDYNVRTKSWGSSAAALATYPWLDFINVEINGELDSYIHQSAPYLRKYVRIPVEEDFTLFATKEGDGLYHTYIGVPIMSNDAIFKYIDEKDFPNVFRSNEPDHWLLYTIDDLMSIDTRKLKLNNDKIYKHIVEEAITIQSKEEFDFLFATLKLMIDVTQQKLSKHPEIAKTITNKKLNQKYVAKELDRIKPKLDFEREYCTEPLCDYINEEEKTKWATPRTFSNEFIQLRQLWRLSMLVRTGAWDFDPFAKGAPEGIVSVLIPTLREEPAFFDNVVEGIFVEDVFINKTIDIPRQCRLENAPQYKQSLMITGNTGAVVKTCTNPKLNIVFDKTLNEPFLTQTQYISYLKPPMREPNIAAVTLGVHLDEMFVNLALVSPDEVALILDQGDIRLYTTDGKVVMIAHDPKDENRKKLLTQKEGSITDPDGNHLYFTQLAKVTDNEGQIVLIEKEVSRTTIINAINSHVKELSRRVITHSSVLIAIALAVLILVLTRVIGAITKPINQLAGLTRDVTSRKLDSITIDQHLLQRKDEIGTLYNSFEEMIKTMQEGNKVRGILDKVVSKQVAAKIVKEGVKLGGEKRTITVVFCDIRNFTSITERMDPVDVLVMLNECLTLLSAVIDDFQGVIDKYEGDKIMTLFGAPLDSEDHSLQAVLCAIEMQKAIAFWNEEREEKNLCRLEIGIGIHTGEAVAGNVGAENHLSYTVLGSIVNLSSRLCDFAGPKEILITEETLKGAKEQIIYEEREAHRFKGFSEPIVTYNVTNQK